MRVLQRNVCLVIAIVAGLGGCDRQDEDTWSSHQDVAAAWGRVRSVSVESETWRLRPYLHRGSGRDCIAHIGSARSGGNCFSRPVDVRAGFGDRHRLVYSDHDVATVRITFVEGSTRDLRLRLDPSVGFRFDIVDLGVKPIAKATAFDTHGNQVSEVGWRDGTYP